ncbi:MAG: signal peptidase I [Methanocalculaceae archaeon]|jgi:signal peptidase|nr:signal peptidase I [Methanocalculaceae archaeon]
MSTFSLLEKMKSDESKISLIHDILLVIFGVTAIGLGLFCVSGTWPAIVAVESESMVPNINVGDLIFVIEKNRSGPLMTGVEAEATGVKSINNYGDVIIYQPNGNPKVTPIIHRALREINESEALAMHFTGDAAHAGYITKGDNNSAIDQGSIFRNDVGPIQPIKKEWIVGKALFSIPLVGYLPLHIRETALLVGVILVIRELYNRMRKKEKEAAMRYQKKGKGGRK